MFRLRKTDMVVSRREAEESCRVCLEGRSEYGSGPETDVTDKILCLDWCAKMSRVRRCPRSRAVIRFLKDPQSLRRLQDGPRLGGRPSGE